MRFMRSAKCDRCGNTHNREAVVGDKMCPIDGSSMPSAAHQLLHYGNGANFREVTILSFEGDYVAVAIPQPGYGTKESELWIQLANIWVSCPPNQGVPYRGIRQKSIGRGFFIHYSHLGLVKEG